MDTCVHLQGKNSFNSHYFPRQDDSFPRNCNCTGTHCHADRSGQFYNVNDNVGLTWGPSSCLTGYWSVPVVTRSHHGESRYLMLNTFSEWKGDSSRRTQFLFYSPVLFLRAVAKLLITPQSEKYPVGGWTYIAAAVSGPGQRVRAIGVVRFLSIKIRVRLSAFIQDECNSEDMLSNAEVTFTDYKQGQISGHDPDRCQSAIHQGAWINMINMKVTHGMRKNHRRGNIKSRLNWQACLWSLWRAAASQGKL